MTVLDAAQVNNREISTVSDAVKTLSTDSQLGFALRAILDDLAEGRDVVLGSVDKHVSPTEAAKMLDMSRTHLYKLLDSEAIAFISVGRRDRRISLEAIAEFKLARDADSKRLAERFANTRTTDASLVDDLLDD